MKALDITNKAYININNCFSKLEIIDENMIRRYQCIFTDNED